MTSAAVSPASAILAHPLALTAMTKIDGPQGPQHWTPWPHQREIAAAVHQASTQPGMRMLVLKARQLGVTWALAAAALWWSLRHPTRTVLIISIGEREAADVLRRVKRLYRSLPSQIRKAYPLKTDQQQRLEIDHPQGPAQILSLPSSSSAGRGLTVSLLIGDEAPKWPHPDEQLASLLPTIADSGNVILGGTANGIGGRFYDLWHDPQPGGWETLFVGADAHPGRDESWIARERNALGSLGPQEYPLAAGEAFLATGGCLFDTGALQELLDNWCAKPRWYGNLTTDATHVRAEPMQANAPWNVWAWPKKEQSYLIAADVCGGVQAGDFTAAVVLGPDGDQVAALHARLEPTDTARQLIRAGYLYNTALLAPEANNHGQAVVALLREWGYPRVYRHERFDARTSSGVRPQMGWLTTLRTKPLAVAALQQGLKEGVLGVRDRAAIGEMLRFIETPEGRMEAGSGHDDRVMSWAIAAAVFSRSRQSKAPASTAGHYRDLREILGG